MSRDPAVLRQVVLVGVVFGATLLVLLGLTAVVGRPGATLTAVSPPPSQAATSGTAATTATASPQASPAPLPSPSPTPAATSDPVLVGAGDIADCAADGDSATAALLDDLPGTVFTTGDNVYEKGTPDEYARCYGPTWGRHLGRTRPAPGNHDWGTGTLDGYFGYFGAAATGPGGRSWYSYDLGSWHVVVLDSSCDGVGGCDPSSPQGTWLAADLAASQATCTIAVFHLPRFSSGFHGDHPIVDPLWQALYAAGADVIVNGHDHDYERFAPQSPAGIEDRERGLRQFVIGTGGAPLRPFGASKPNSELRVSVTPGLLEFTLRDGSYDWRYIPTAGDFADRGTARCH